MTANKVDPSIFGAELAALRRKCGMTQADLGRASNINPQYISLLENGKREAGLSTIVALAQALGVLPGVLINTYVMNRSIDRKMNKGKPPQD